MDAALLPGRKWNALRPGCSDVGGGGGGSDVCPAIFWQVFTVDWSEVCILEACASQTNPAPFIVC